MKLPHRKGTKPGRAEREDMNMMNNTMELNKNMTELSLNELEAVSGGWDWFNCIVGASAGAVAGAIGGAFTGGPLGVFIGLVGGAVAGGIAGGVD